MSRNRHGKRDSKHYFEWMEYASEDLAAAVVLAEDATCVNAACFHCQQTIEKALKAYLLFVGGHSVDGHNLSWLVRQACKYHSAFGGFIARTAALNRYYIECRYPSDRWETPDAETMSQTLQVTRELYEYVCTMIYDGDYDKEYRERKGN